MKLYTRSAPIAFRFGFGFNHRSRVDLLPFTRLLDHLLNKRMGDISYSFLKVITTVMEFALSES